MVRTGNKDFRRYTAGIFEHEDLQLLKGLSNHGTVDLYDHSVNVSYLSMQVCSKLGLDARTAARAGLLHDFFLYDWRKGEGPRWHGFRHGAISLRESKRRFDLSPKEEKIILRHMWPLIPIPPSSPEGLIVSMVDKYCALNEIFNVEGPETDHNCLPGGSDAKGKGMKNVLICNLVKTRIIGSRLIGLVYVPSE